MHVLYHNSALYNVFYTFISETNDDYKIELIFQYTLPTLLKYLGLICIYKLFHISTSSKRHVNRVVQRDEKNKFGGIKS